MTKADLVPPALSPPIASGAGAPPVAVTAPARPAFPFEEGPSSSSSSSLEHFVSAVTGEGLEELRALLASRLSLVEAEGELLVLERHREALVSAASSLRGAAEHARSASFQPELTAARVREALSALGAITGETATEELLDRIFATFCVGK
jgi:tRNA modification GTPase